MLNYPDNATNNLYYKNRLPGTLEGREGEVQDRNSDDDSINTGISSVTRTVALGGENSSARKFPPYSSFSSNFIHNNSQRNERDGRILASSMYVPYTYDVLEKSERRHKNISFPSNNGSSSTHNSLLNNKVHIRVNHIPDENIKSEISSTRSPSGCIQLDATGTADTTTRETHNHNSANGATSSNVYTSENIKKDMVTNSLSLLPPRLPPKPNTALSNSSPKPVNATMTQILDEPCRVMPSESHKKANAIVGPEKIPSQRNQSQGNQQQNIASTEGSGSSSLVCPPLPYQVSPIVGVSTIGEIGTTKRDFGIPLPPKEALSNLGRNLSVCSTSSDFTTTSYHIRSDGSMTSDFIPPTLTSDSNIRNKRKIGEIDSESAINSNVPIKSESNVDVDTNDLEGDNGIDNKHIYSKRAKNEDETTTQRVESLQEKSSPEQKVPDQKLSSENNSEKSNVKMDEISNGLPCARNVSSLTSSIKVDTDKTLSTTGNESKLDNFVENPKPVDPSSCFNTLNIKPKSQGDNGSSDPKQIYEGAVINASTSITSDDNATKATHYSKDTNTSRTQALFVSIKSNDEVNLSKSPSMKSNDSFAMTSVTPTLRNPSPKVIDRNEAGTLNANTSSMTINVPNTPLGENEPLSNSSTMLVHHNSTGSLSNQGSIENQTPIYYTIPPSSVMQNGTPSYHPPMNQQKQNQQSQHTQPPQHMPYYPPQVQSTSLNNSSQSSQQAPRYVSLSKPPLSTSRIEATDTALFSNSVDTKDSKTKEVLDCKKHPWTDEEDEKLKVLVKQYGARDWGKIAANLNHRNGKQCHQRWNYFLNPMVRRGLWSKEEDELILFHQTQIGNKWAKIANYLPGRTGHAVKNRYHQIINGIRRGRSASEANVGGILGEMRNKKQNNNDAPPEVQINAPLPPPPSMTAPQIPHISSNVSINNAGNYGVSSNMSVTSQSSNVTGYNSLGTNLYPMSTHSLHSTGSLCAPSQFNGNMNFNPYPYAIVTPLASQNHQLNGQEITRLNGGSIPPHPTIVPHLKVNGNMFPFSQFPH